MNGLQLADPKYFKSNKIDILLAADITMMSMNGGERIVGNQDEPIATATEFGYLITGRVSQESAYCHLATDNISQVLTKFWEIEEVSSNPPVTSDEEQSEKERTKLLLVQKMANL